MDIISVYDSYFIIDIIIFSGRTITRNHEIHFINRDFRITPDQY